MRGSSHGRCLADAAFQAAALARSVELFERVARAPSQGLPVLMYHRVAGDGEDLDLDPSLLSPTPEQFERQMAFLAATWQCPDPR